MKALGAPNSTKTKEALGHPWLGLGFSNQANIGYLTQTFE